MEVVPFERKVISGFKRYKSDDLINDDDVTDSSRRKVEPQQNGMKR
jgi:hypothetical protein